MHSFPVWIGDPNRSLPLKTMELETSQGAGKPTVTESSSQTIDPKL
jgi:hypothetical protein